MFGLIRWVGGAVLQPGDAGLGVARAFPIFVGELLVLPRAVHALEVGVFDASGFCQFPEVGSRAFAAVLGDDVHDGHVGFQRGRVDLEEAVRATPGDAARAIAPLELAHDYYEDLHAQQDAGPACSWRQLGVQHAYGPSAPGSRPSGSTASPSGGSLCHASPSDARPRGRF